MIGSTYSWQRCENPADNFYAGGALGFCEAHDSLFTTKPGTSARWRAQLWNLAMASAFLIAAIVSIVAGGGEAGISSWMFLLLSQIWLAASSVLAGMRGE